MRAVVQRVTSCKVLLEHEAHHDPNHKESRAIPPKKEIARIGHGLLVYIGIGTDDTSRDVAWMVHKISHLAIFSNDEGKLMHSIIEQEAPELMLISQFTLLADTRKGKRASYHRAASASDAQPLYQQCADALNRAGISVHTGKFGGMMQIISTNDGPVTLLLNSRHTRHTGHIRPVSM